MSPAGVSTSGAGGDGGGIDLRAALEALPHGPEFRFLDELLALDPGRSGEALYTVRGDEAFLAGHFPGRPILPGVILAEAIAQLAGVVAQSDRELVPLADLRLTALRNVKIRGAAGPGDRLLIRATISGRLGNLIQAEGSAALVGEGATGVGSRAGAAAQDRRSGAPAERSGAATHSRAAGATRRQDAHPEEASGEAGEPPETVAGGPTSAVTLATASLTLSG